MEHRIQLLCKPNQQLTQTEQTVKINDNNLTWNRQIIQIDESFPSHLEINKYQDYLTNLLYEKNIRHGHSVGLICFGFQNSSKTRNMFGTESYYGEVDNKQNMLTKMFKKFKQYLKEQYYHLGNDQIKFTIQCFEVYDEHGTEVVQDLLDNQYSNQIQQIQQFNEIQISNLNEIRELLDLVRSKSKNYLRKENQFIYLNNQSHFFIQLNLYLQYKNNLHKQSFSIVDLAGIDDHDRSIRRLAPLNSYFMKVQEKNKEFNGKKLPNIQYMVGKEMKEQKCVVVRFIYQLMKNNVGFFMNLFINLEQEVNRNAKFMIDMLENSKVSYQINKNVGLIQSLDRFDTVKQLDYGLKQSRCQIEQNIQQAMEEQMDEDKQTQMYQSQQRYEIDNNHDDNDDDLKQNYENEFDDHNQNDDDDRDGYEQMQNDRYQQYQQQQCTGLIQQQDDNFIIEEENEDLAESDDKNIQWENEKLQQIQKKSTSMSDRNKELNLQEYEYKKEKLLPRLLDELKQQKNQGNSLYPFYEQLFELFNDCEQLFQKMTQQFVDFKNNLLEFKAETDLKFQDDQEQINFIKIKYRKLQQEKGIEKIVDEYENEIQKQIRMRNSVQNENNELLQKISQLLDLNNQPKLRSMRQQKYCETLNEQKNQLIQRNIQLTNNLKQRDHVIEQYNQKMRQNNVATKLYNDLLQKAQKMQTEIQNQQLKVDGSEKKQLKLATQNANLLRNKVELEKINQMLKQELERTQNQLFNFEKQKNKQTVKDSQPKQNLLVLDCGDDMKMIADRIQLQKSQRNQTKGLNLQLKSLKGVL